MNRHTPRRGPLLGVPIAVAGLKPVSALAGALGLAAGFLSLDEVLTARLPWGSALFGGVALGLLVALPNGSPRRARGPRRPQDGCLEH